MYPLALTCFPHHIPTVVQCRVGAYVGRNNQLADFCKCIWHNGGIEEMRERVLVNVFGIMVE